MGRIFNVCPDCGANLDPSERCTCQDEKERKRNINNLYFESWEQLQLDLGGTNSEQNSKTYT